MPWSWIKCWFLVRMLGMMDSNIPLYLDCLIRASLLVAYIVIYHHPSFPKTKIRNNFTKKSATSKPWKQTLTVFEACRYCFIIFDVKVVHPYMHRLECQRSSLYWLINSAFSCGWLVWTEYANLLELPKYKIKNYWI